MTYPTQKALLLLFVVMAATILYRPAEVVGMKLEDANTDGMQDNFDNEEASFSELDADALADKLDAEDDDALNIGDEEMDGLDQEDTDHEAQSFLEVRKTRKPQHAAPVREVHHGVDWALRWADGQVVPVLVRFEQSQGWNTWAC